MTDLQTIEEMLEKCLPAASEGYGLLSEAMRYSVLGGGKRLRAIMLIESFRLFSDDRELEKYTAHPFACAIECINYSMELITRAGEELEKNKPDYYMDNMRNFMHAARVLFTNAGAFGMIGGQVLDVEGFGDERVPDREMLATLCELKTSKLFEAALCCGAILAGADESAVSLLGDIGRLMGLAFQIRDDVLDVTASFEELGKDIGSDEKNNKATFVSLFGLDAAKERISELYGEMKSKLEVLPGEKTAFENLFDKLFMI